MQPNTIQLRIAALLFLVTTTSFIVGNSLLEAALMSPSAFEAMRTQVLIGSSFEIINAIGVFLIAVMLFQTLWQHSQIIALSYLGFRLIETILLSVGTANALLPLQLAGSVGAGWTRVADDQRDARVAWHSSKYLFILAQRVV